MTVDSMGELEFTTPKLAWGGEATAFTPALAQRLGYLGEACGLGPLEPQGIEVPVGSRRIDVLAVAEQRSVVIENQYGTADHDHLTRGLAYAVAQQAAALVVVAERHTDEFVAVADYLNRLAGSATDDEQAVSVWLVEVQAVRRVGDVIWSPLFSVRARPNEWAREARRTVTKHDVTDVKGVVSAAIDPDTAEWIVETWIAEPHSATAIGGDVRPTVQLRHPDPADPDKGHALLTVMTQRVWVNVTYIFDSSGGFEDSERRADFEARLRAAFPQAASKYKTLPGYFAIEYAEIQQRREACADLIGWLLQQLDQEMAAVGEQA